MEAAKVKHPGKIANLNAVKNGTKITRLTIGELPPAMRRQLRRVRKYRCDLEQLVLEAHGEVNATHAHLIDEAAAAEVHATICRWLLRTRLAGSDEEDRPPMPTADVVKCSEQMLKAKTIRNKAVERLRINAEPEPVTLESYVINAKGASNGKRTT